MPFILYLSPHLTYFELLHFHYEVRIVPVYVSLYVILKIISIIYYPICQINPVTFVVEVRRGSDRMVVGFTTTYAINAYHH
jgi:hypothetical protein